MWLNLNRILFGLVGKPIVASFHWKVFAHKILILPTGWQQMQQAFQLCLEAEFTIGVFYGLGENAVFHANFETLIDPPWSAETYSGVFGIQQSLSTNYVYESSDPEIGASAIRCIKGEAAAGCNIVNACNYTSDNEDDDSTCLLPQSIAGNICDDGDSTTIYDVYQDDCFSCSGISELVASDGSGPCEGQDFLEFNSVLYELVEVSGNCWFKSNLRTELFANGDSIPSSFIETSDLAVLANSGFENLEAICTNSWVEVQLRSCIGSKNAMPVGLVYPKE